MIQYQRKLLTIITEAVIENMLIKELDKLGASGYTVSDARGKGNRGMRTGTWDANSSIRIEVVCDAQTADVITTFIHTHYYENYAMILFIADVEVLQPSKLNLGI
jgi:nitrogen regulatory protein PII